MGMGQEMRLWACGMRLANSDHRPRQPASARFCLLSPGPRGSQEMMQPCLIYLHIISLVALCAGAHLQLLRGLPVLPNRLLQVLDLQRARPKR